MERHSLKDLSWNVTEEVYRKDAALSYSTLSRYERNGKFDSLDTLFDKITTPSLTFGSLVDTILLGEQGELEEKFVIADLPELTDSLQEIAEQLFLEFGNKPFEEISDEDLARVGKDKGYYASDKYKNYRIKQIKENCGRYFELRGLSADKTLVSTKEYEDAIACRNAILENPKLRFLVSSNPFNDNIEVFHQLKFKASLDGIDYRCMMDSCVVDHKNKMIYPVDLKTSSKPEWHFYKSFLEYRYDIQACLYSRILKFVISQDEYYKDFKVADYVFIDVNRKTLKPLMWMFPFTHSETGWQYTTPWGTVNRLRSPYEIGKELDYYLKHPSDIPVDIEKEKVNNIVEFLEK